jgi:predicted amidohydrolase
MGLAARENIGVMEVRDVCEILAPLALEPPDLEMLRPTEASYTCLLLQPSGPIFAGRDRIGGLDQDVNGQKALAFARLANERGAHLAVAPEYFTPWSAVRSLIGQGVVPRPGALWVLGCESIHQDELAQFKGDVAHSCEVLYEPCDALAADRPLLDPVVLLFATKRTDGISRLVALVQFKTHPSRDHLFFEEGLLKRGTAVYRFRGVCGTLSTVTLICSDAFAIDDALVRDLVDRSTIIHIQLNPDPRNSVYRQYRKTAFDLDSRVSDCHILCLNWARTVIQHDDDGKTEIWPAVGCSTWYCPEDACAQTDDIVLPNHHLGLYYTHMKERRHALLFDYDEAVFECRVPKVVTRGQAVLANKNGPNPLVRYEWDNNESAWVAQSEPRKADFDQVLSIDAGATTALANQELDNVLNIERLLALSAGAINGQDGWHSLKNIDSFGIGSDEIVRRITVAQDTSESAEEFRHARLAVVAHIRHELDTRPTWPPQIAGTDKNAQIKWDVGTGHFNIRCADGKPELICYLGETPTHRVLENVPSMLTDLLRRSNSPHQNRLCVLYRRYGELKFAQLPVTRFDDALMDQRDILSANTDDSTEQI